MGNKIIAHSESYPIRPEHIDTAKRFWGPSATLRKRYLLFGLSGYARSWADGSRSPRSSSRPSITRQASATSCSMAWIRMDSSSKTGHSTK